jgi:hypothetical protein
MQQLSQRAAPSSRVLLPLALACLLSVLSLPLVASHYASPSVRSLTIHSVDSGSAGVTLADRKSKGPMAECSFVWTTNENGVAEKPVEVAVVEKTGPGRVDVREVARAHDGGCITSTADYWTYELCFGKHLKQYHGADVYWLAKMDAGQQLDLASDAMSFNMGKGDMCDALSPPAPRSVKVNWACRESATTPHIVSIAETSTCVYALQVASSEVCRDARFPVIANDWVPPNQGASGPLDTGSEDWFLELTELEASDENGEPILMCQAYSLEYRATSVKSLKFARYELKITKLQGDAKKHRSQIEQLPREYQLPAARRASRQPVSTKHLSSAYGHVALAPKADGYDGALSFLKVYA